jgi:enoyl-CoA hydratase/carnithine racemase
MTAPTVLVTTAAGVTTIRIDRAAKKNALDGDTYRGLADAFTAAAADDACRAIVLTGGPDVFTAGNDLADFARVSAGGGGLSAGDFLRALVEQPKPIVAAVAGWAVGIGTTMLLHCDFVYAAPSAQFKTPFVDLGLCPEAASSVLLPATIGRRAAAEMLLLGATVDAARAVELGLVTAVVDDPLASAAAVAAELATKPPIALRKTKELVRRVHRSDITDALAAEQDAFLGALRGDEARNAVMAMLAKRAPR